MRTSPVFRNARFWFACFIAWFVLLFILSSTSGSPVKPPPIRHFDKIAHFGYFFGGAGLMSAWLYFRNPGNASWPRIILTVTGLFALIGALDEWRQTFTPGRSGNDPFDWLADILGALAGAFVFKAVHRWIR